MCKFHKDVARALATDPATNTFDPDAYAVALLAVAQFRIENIMPALFDCGGDNRLELATPRARAAYEGASLARHMVGNEEALCRTALRESVGRQALNLPADPVKDTAFLDEATYELFTGYDDKERGYASRPLSFVEQAHRPDFAPLLVATRAFAAQPGVTPALQRLFEQNVTRLFDEAQTQTPRLLAHAYGFLPGRLRGAFKSCAVCVGTGAGGAAVSHLGCVAALAFGGAGGAALSSKTMALMTVTSPLLAAGITAGIDKWRTGRISLVKAGGAAALGLGLAVAAQNFGGHEDHHAHHGALDPEAALCRADQGVGNNRYNTTEKPLPAPK